MYFKLLIIQFCYLRSTKTFPVEFLESKSELRQKCTNLHFNYVIKNVVLLRKLYNFTTYSVDVIYKYLQRRNNEYLIN